VHVGLPAAGARNGGNAARTRKASANQISRQLYALLNSDVTSTKLAIEMASSTCKTILCVDDEPAVLKTLELILRMHGYRVLSATNVADAIDVVRRNKIDVALVDHSVCHSRQLCFMQEIQKHQPGMRVAVHSGQPELEDCVRKAPIIQKPIDPRLLVAAIERICAEDAA
jgi:DNA-binding NtrC family response regulator